MQPVRDHYPGLLSPAKSTMQLFMWQHAIVGVANYFKDCFDVRGALSDAPDGASTSSSPVVALTPLTLNKKLKSPYCNSIPAALL